MISWLPTNNSSAEEKKIYHFHHMKNPKLTQELNTISRVTNHQLTIKLFNSYTEINNKKNN